MTAQFNLIRLAVVLALAAATVYGVMVQKPVRPLGTEVPPASSGQPGQPTPVAAPAVPTLAELLAPNGCSVAAADEFTKDAREIVGQLLATNAVSPYPVSFDTGEPAVVGDQFVYTGRVRRSVRVTIEPASAGRFPVTMTSDPPGGKSHKAELALVANDPDVPLPPDARPLAAATQENLLANLSDIKGLRKVVLLSGPPAARRIETRLTDRIGIDLEPVELTLEPHPSVARSYRLVIQSPKCEVHFRRDADKWTLLKIALVAGKS